MQSLLWGQTGKEVRQPTETKLNKWLKRCVKKHCLWKFLYNAIIMHKLLDLWLIAVISNKPLNTERTEISTCTSFWWQYSVLENFSLQIPKHQIAYATKTKWGDLLCFTWWINSTIRKRTHELTSQPFLYIPSIKCISYFEPEMLATCFPHESHLSVEKGEIIQPQNK